MLAHVSNFPVGQDRRGRGTGAARSADPRPESGNPSGTPQPTIPLALGKARPAKGEPPEAWWRTAPSNQAVEHLGGWRSEIRDGKWLIVDLGIAFGFVALCVAVSLLI